MTLKNTKQPKLRVLIACEYSGIVREEFKKLGWDAWSCDLLPTEIPGQHYRCDIIEVLDKDWDLLIGHPPCTYLCNSGVCWLYNKDGCPNSKRWAQMRKGAKFFKTLWHCKIPRICLENPIPHKYAVAEIGVKYSQLVQPFWFGHPETKATCLWLKNLPKLVPTNKVEPVNGSVMHKLPPSKDRWKIRSKTYKGLAVALAKQFDTYIRNTYGNHH